MSFAPLADGMTSAPTTFTVTSAAALAVGDAQRVHHRFRRPAQFMVMSDACTGETLATNGSCTVVLFFAPTVAGPISASLTIASSTGTASAGLSGVGLVPGAPAKVAWAQATYDAGTTMTSTTTTLILANGGSVAAGIPTFTTGGANPTDFVVGATTCDGGVQAGSSCNVAVTVHDENDGLPVGHSDGG